MATSNTGGYSAPTHLTMMRTPPPSGGTPAASAPSNNVDPFAGLGGNSMTTSSSTPQQQNLQGSSPSLAAMYGAQPTAPAHTAAPSNSSYDPFAGVTDQSQAQQQQRPMEMFQTPQPMQTYQSPQPIQGYQSPQPMLSTTSSYAPPTTPSTTSFTTPSATTGGATASGSTPINGLFLGLEKPTPPASIAGSSGRGMGVPDENGIDNDEDKEVQRAREAALYAEEMLKAEKAKRKKGGPLGFGLLPKAQQLIPKNLPSAPTISLPSMPSIPSAATSSGSSGGGGVDGPSITVNGDDAAGHGLAPGETPPWYSTNNKNLNSSEDYGISGGVNQVDTAGGGNGEKKSVGRGAAVTGAAAIGGIAGLIAVGPIVGVAAAGGVAYAAATKDGALGKGIRGAGGLVAQAGSGLKKIEDQTGIAKGTANGLAKGVSWVMKKAVEHS